MWLTLRMSALAGSVRLPNITSRRPDTCTSLGAFAANPDDAIHPAAEDRLPYQPIVCFETEEAARRHSMVPREGCWNAPNAYTL